MTKNQILDIIKTTAILFAICVIITAALGFTNEYTKEPIAEINKQTEQATMQELVKAETYEDINVKFEDKDYQVNLAKNGEEIVAYIFSMKEKGYGGDVSVMTAIGTDSKILAVKVVDASNETPGLGQNVIKESFYSQFSGKSGELEAVKSNAADNQITAVTGATISSKAVTNAVNKSQKIFEYMISQNGGVN